MRNGILAACSLTLTLLTAACGSPTPGALGVQPTQPQSSVAATESETPTAVSRPEIDSRVTEDLAAHGAAQVYIEFRTGTGFDDLDPASRRVMIASLQDELGQILPAHSLEVTKPYPMMGGLAADITASALEVLSQHPQIKTIYLNTIAEPIAAR